MTARTDALELVAPGELEGRRRQASDRGACRIHFTAIENCIDEHGLDLEPVYLSRVGSERHP